MNMLIVGGDQRQIEIIRYFKNKGYNIHLLGFENLMQSFVEVRKIKQSELDLNDYDVIVLPVNGISDDGSIKAVFSHYSIVFREEDFLSLSKSVKIFTGSRQNF